VPDRTTVGRWWGRYLSFLEETFAKISGMLQLVTPTILLIVDSTLLVDLYDMEAGWGYTSRGKFRGFKLHAAVNQEGLPLKSGGYFREPLWLRSKIKYAELLVARRYVVEQFNGHMKDNVLKECWVRPRGLVKKAAMVMAGLISYDAEAIRSLVVGEEVSKL
jgi:hypothetical protein